MSPLLQDYLTRSAERSPDRVAVVMAGERLTYGQLELESNRLARLLVEVGCRRGDRVCLLLPKSPAAIVSMIAVLKADGVYVPIDIDSPAPRLARIMSACEPRLVLACAETTDLADELEAAGALDGGVPVGLLDDSSGGESFEPVFRQADREIQDAEPLSPANGPEDLAHLLFTSGSTGTPKGVMITHANVAHFVEWATAYFGTASSDRISGHPPLHFDLSTFDIYGTFLAGAELHLVPAAASLQPAGLVDFIRDQALTQWFSVPSALTFIAKYGVLRPDDFPHLKRLIWCGEVLPTPTLIEWMRRLPHVEFTNLYGPTEATIASSYYTVPACPTDSTAPIPIGVACAGEELAVLDGNMQPIPQDEIGEVYIGGVGLSSGYWRDEEKTAAAFRPHPTLQQDGARLYRTGDLGRLAADGLVYFLGRADSQIKSRGYRIELGEIEAALNAQTVLKECAVVGVTTGGFEGTTICCAYVPVDGEEISQGELRRRLSELLPSYMLPSRWLSVGALPKNLNGKIDRPKLRDHFEREASAAVAKVGELDSQRMVAVVQAEVAGLLGHGSADAVDPRLAFVELGVDSLAAVELRNRLSNVTGLRLPTTLIFDHPSVAAVAEFLRVRVQGDGAAGGSGQGRRRVMTAGSEEVVEALRASLKDTERLRRENRLLRAREGEPVAIV
ncbi:MAG TPA: amino acid adenylation domain-containing protein, partial [Solirubrobacteraceae bacterium]|nr:amino acid adenylation domain-containing protein [Solirubrobacteraceae bacterium]